MPTVVQIKINPAAVSALAHSPDGMLARYLYDRMTVVQLASVRQCPKAANGGGKLSESIVKRWYPTLTGQEIDLVAAQPYAYWVHEGTGIYGPRGAPIVPVNASVLRWIGEDGLPVFAKSVKGMRARHFLSDNLPLFFA